MKCQQYETKTKIITSRVNEHNCLRPEELERTGRGSGEESVEVKRRRENENTQVECPHFSKTQGQNVFSHVCLHPSSYTTQPLFGRTINRTQTG